jgi:hypothetical protein
MRSRCNMTFADDRTDGGGVTPRAERGVDPERQDLEQDLVSQPARPLTDEEREAASSDPGREARVYAPQSERVPREPIPGDAELIQGGTHTEEGE